MKSQWTETYTARLFGNDSLLHWTAHLPSGREWLDYNEKIADSLSRRKRGKEENIAGRVTKIIPNVSNISIWTRHSKCSLIFKTHLVPLVLERELQLHLESNNKKQPESHVKHSPNSECIHCLIHFYKMCLSYLLVWIWWRVFLHNGRNLT